LLKSIIFDENLIKTEVIRRTDVVSNIMKTLQTILISLISLTLYSQNEAFQIILSHDTIIVNRADTVFTHNTDNGEYRYDNQKIHIIRNDGQLTTKFSVIINGFQEESQSKLPIAKLVTHGRQTTIDNESKKVIIEGDFVRGKQIGVWHDRSDEFDIISFFDSTGIKMPIVKYEIDTPDQKIYISEIDTLTYNYTIKQKINLIINPANYFRTESKKMYSEDTMRFCILNLHMDTLGYESWKTSKLDYIRFVWFRAENPLNLNVKCKGSILSYDLLVTDAEFDFDFGSVVQRNFIEIKESKDFMTIKNDLDKMNFWGQISKDGCYGDYIFVEARFGEKYNSKRINCLEYRLPENKKIMKLFEKIAKNAGLEKSYRIEY